MASGLSYVLTVLGSAVVFFAAGVLIQRFVHKNQIEKGLGDPSSLITVGSLKFYAVPVIAQVRTFDSAIRYKIPLKRTRKKKEETAVEQVVIPGDVVTKDLSKDSRSQASSTGSASTKAPVFPPND